MNWPTFNIIDISQPVDATSGYFPGDTPFQKTVVETLENSGILNLTAFTMSPHVGTHADAPFHVEAKTKTAGNLALDPYIGPAMVLDVSNFDGVITPEIVEPLLLTFGALPERLLFRTQRAVEYDRFKHRYASFSSALIEMLGEKGVRLIGLDTPSVDPVDSKTMDAHHALLAHHMAWLENLDLTQAPIGTPVFLIALPLKLMELEASPVRAVLLTPSS